MNFILQNSETRNLQQVANRASQFAKGDNHREAARMRREPNLSYDDPEKEDYQHILNFKLTKVTGRVWVAAVILVVVVYYLFVPHK